jgi:biopolymer transport protein ExbD
MILWNFHWAASHRQTRIMQAINSKLQIRKGNSAIRLQRYSLRIDMTPMVDLGFLLITFFVMTVHLTQPSVVNLDMPKDGPETPVGNSKALTVLLHQGNAVYYYEGEWQQALKQNRIFKTNLSVTSGVGAKIREKQQWLDQYDTKEGRSGLMLIIKAGSGAFYSNVVDALDEALINGVKKYTLLSANPEEQNWLGHQ